MLAESVNDVATRAAEPAEESGRSRCRAAGSRRGMNRELQQELMRIRMVPLSSIAERLYRIVRQTAKELDKTRQPGDQGRRGGTGPQRAGKNDGAVRTSAAQCPGPWRGKRGRQDSRPASRKPGLSAAEARQEGNEIVLTLSDDGAGLDLDAHPQPAQSNWACSRRTANRAGTPDRHDLRARIFHRRRR